MHTFCMWSLFPHMNLPTKKWKLPHSFGDKPLATAWQPESERGRKIRIWKFQAVAMEIWKKLSKSSHIGPMVLTFCMWSLLPHMDLPTKNEENLPQGFAWQPKSERGPGVIGNVFRSFMASFWHPFIVQLLPLTVTSLSSRKLLSVGNGVGQVGNH